MVHGRSLLLSLLYWLVAAQESGYNLINKLADPRRVRLVDERIRLAVNGAETRRWRQRLQEALRAVAALVRLGVHRARVVREALLEADVFAEDVERAALGPAPLLDRHVPSVHESHK